MEKEFVPYELAVKLKELGFNEPCIAYYTGRGIVYDVYTVSNFSGRNVLGGKAISTPLWQQAVRFLNIISDNQINITINGKDDYEGLCKKFEKAIKYFGDL